MLSGNSYRRNILKINVDKCVHLPQPISRIKAVDLNATVSDVFYENHAPLSTDFKALCFIAFGIFEQIVQNLGVFRSLSSQSTCFSHSLKNSVCLSGLDDN